MRYKYNPKIEKMDIMKELNSIAKNILEEAAEKKKKYPQTVIKAVDKLVSKLPKKERKKIARMKKKKLVNLHFGLGLYIRNNFGLWQGNDALKQDCGTEHEDDCSGVIIKALWERLTEKC